VEKLRDKAFESFGLSHNLFCVLQLTHSGRFSRPGGTPKPQGVRLIPETEEDTSPIKILTDAELDCLQEKFVESAKLATWAGFDAVDIKACHGYLVNDLLASHTRANSKYGGSFSNRTRFLLETVQKIHSEIPDLLLSVRLNIYDGLAYPNGFGVSRDGSLDADLKEPTQLIERLKACGCSLLSLTLGNPHKKPHLGRPFDRPLAFSTVPSEHPLEGVGRLLGLTGQIQKTFPNIPCVGTGYSWLRQYFPQVAAASLKRGEVSFVGLGRSSFAYPNAPRDLMERGMLDKKKVCVTCSCCSELARAGRPAGCVIRDKPIYAKEYREHFGKRGQR
jgi:2,4-dienoyl-CoA reductase (NADPH2)